MSYPEQAPQHESPAIPHDADHLDPVPANPTSASRNTNAMRSVVDLKPSRIIINASTSDTASHSAAPASIKVPAKASIDIGINTSTTHPRLTTRQTSLTIVEPSFGPRSSRPSPQSSPITSRPPSFTTTPIKTIEHLNQRRFSSPRAATFSSGSSIQQPQRPYTSRPSTSSSSLTAPESPNDSTSDSQPLLWTQAMSDRLLFVQAQKAASQRRWSAGQERWIAEEDRLLEIRKAVLKAGRKEKKKKLVRMKKGLGGSWPGRKKGIVGGENRVGGIVGGLSSEIGSKGEEVDEEAEEESEGNEEDESAIDNGDGDDDEDVGDLLPSNKPQPLAPTSPPEFAPRPSLSLPSASAAAVAYSITPSSSTSTTPTTASGLSLGNLFRRMSVTNRGKKAGKGLKRRESNAV